MNWLYETLWQHTPVQAVVIICLICALGLALGKLRFRGISLGVTYVFFIGILFGLAEPAQIPMEFNETLWHTLVDHVTIHNDERIVFTFTDGTEIVTML